MKKVLINILTIFSLLASNSRAEEIVSITKGTPAPFSGQLFPHQQAEDVRYRLLEADVLKKINISLNTSLNLYVNNEKLYDDKVSLLLKRNDDLAKSLESANRMNDYERMFWFGIGAVLAAGAAYVGSKAIK